MRAEASELQVAAAGSGLQADDASVRRGPSSSASLLPVEVDLGHELRDMPAAQPAWGLPPEAGAAGSGPGGGPARAGTAVSGPHCPLRRPVTDDRAFPCVPLLRRGCRRWMPERCLSGDENEYLL